MLYPRPLSRLIVMEKETIDMIHQILLINDDYVRIAAHELIKQAYLDKFSISEFLRNSAFFERVLLNLTQDSAKLALGNFRTIFFSLQDVNERQRSLF